MIINIPLIAASLLGFSGIALGAYGDHGLKGKLSEAAMHSFESALKYQQLHALALLAIGLALCVALPPLLAKKLLLTALVMLAGTLLFSGSIYANIFLDIKGITKLTPIGGMTLMAGWLMLIWVGIGRGA